MLRSFIAWLDDYLAGEGPPAVARAVVGILSFAALLGALFGSVAVKAGILVAVLLALVGMALLLLADRRSLRSKYEAHRSLVSRYCAFISKEMKTAPQIVEWDQTTTVDSRGDVKESIVIRGKTLRDNIQFFRLTSDACWEMPQRLRRKVQINVRSVSVTGVPGTRLTVSSTWTTNSRIDLIVHFCVPPRGGSEISIAIDWEWPGKCIPLVRGEPDDFVFLMRGHPITFGRKKVILPEGCDAYYEPVGFSEDEEGFRLDRTVNSEGRVQFLFECHQLDVYRRAGVRLELKKKGVIA